MGRFCKQAAVRIQLQPFPEERLSETEHYLLVKITPQGSMLAQEARLTKKARALQALLAPEHMSIANDALQHALRVARAGRDPRFVNTVRSIETASSERAASERAGEYLFDMIDTDASPEDNHVRIVAAVAALNAVVRGNAQRSGVALAVHTYASDVQSVCDMQLVKVRQHRDHLLRQLAGLQKDRCSVHDTGRIAAQVAVGVGIGAFLSAL